MSQEKIGDSLDIVNDVGFYLFRVLLALCDSTFNICYKLFYLSTVGNTSIVTKYIRSKAAAAKNLPTIAMTSFSTVRSVPSAEKKIIVL